MKTRYTSGNSVISRGQHQNIIILNIDNLTIILAIFGLSRTLLIELFGILRPSGLQRKNKNPSFFYWTVVLKWRGVVWDFDWRSQARSSGEIWDRKPRCNYSEYFLAFSADHESEKNHTHQGLSTKLAARTFQIMPLPLKWNFGASRI